MSQQQLLEYQRLRQQGMSGQQAFNQVWPNGLPTQEQQAKKAAKGQQMAGLAQVGGMVGGAVAGRYAMNHFDDFFDSTAKDAATETSKTFVNNAVNESVAAQGGNAAAAPTNLRESLTPGASNGYTLGVDGSVAPETPNVQSATRAPAANEVLNPDGSVTDANTGMTTGQWVQGAAGAYQVISGIQQFQNGDKLGGGLSTVTGAANIGAVAGSETAAAAVPGLNAALGVYQGYKTTEAIGKMPAGGARNKAGIVGGASAGASIGTAIMPGFGTAVGAVIGATVGGLASLTGSGKDKYQMIRDAGRKALVQQGVLSKDYQGTLADGSAYDFGKDGKKAGKLNTSDPNWGKVAALANVIASGEGTFGRSREAMATMYANAAMSNAGGDYNKALANIQHFANQRGMTPDALRQQFAKMKEEGNLKENEFATFNADIKKVFGGPVAQPKQQQKQQQPVQQQQKQSLAYQKAEAKQNNDFRTQLAKNLYGGK